jgi:hypothetical protein
MGRLCSTTQLCGPAVSWINVSFDFLAVDYVSLCSSLACALALQPVVRSPRPPCNPCTTPPLHAARSTLPLWIDIKIACSYRLKRPAADRVCTLHDALFRTRPCQVCTPPRFALPLPLSFSHSHTHVSTRRRHALWVHPPTRCMRSQQMNAERR